MNIRRFAFLGLAIIWMIVIYAYSAQPGDVSGAKSTGISYTIGRIFIEDFDSLPQEAQDAFAEKMDFPVRKCAHMTEYSLLAFLLTGFFCDIKEKAAKKQLFLAWLFTTLYAATDELHQRFVPERSGELRDVAIDGLGALLGIFLFTLSLRLFYRSKQRRNSRRSPSCKS